MKKTVELIPFYHRGKRNIAFVFKTDLETSEIIKSIEGSRWSQSKACWYIYRNNKNFDAIFEAFKGKVWLKFEALKSKTKPEEEPQEIVAEKLEKQPF